MYREYKNKGVAFVGIFVEDTVAGAERFVKAHPVSFPYGYDWQLALAGPLGFNGMPYTVVFSREGEMVRRVHGPVSKTDLVTTIEGLLARR